MTAAGAALLPQARLIIEQWEHAQIAVLDAAAEQRMTLTVGFHTRIGRGLIPKVTATMARSLPGWKLLFRQISWADPTVGLASGEADVAIGWLPVLDDGMLSWRVVAMEDRWVALPAGHRLAAREVVEVAELAVVWRTKDDRHAVRFVIDACTRCLCGQSPATGSSGWRFDARLLSPRSSCADEAISCPRCAPARPSASGQARDEPSGVAVRDRGAFRLGEVRGA